MNALHYEFAATMSISKRWLVTALANPCMSERYGLRKLNMSALGQKAKYSL
jgi:hypothetical protein